ncbi:hypothetical protein OU798_11740 [Prolixibacteraceae bacterium Z1-6]|uniref:T9SS C-terminal target domain-containing protein n=1 Tax=Draconibacterium aestuarii TaxID=2998507 RepID=A0A9X3J627_9BACT|nr:hypothetical protein [Prolixibacteraceae bacterium Z1-6]
MKIILSLPILLLLVFSCSSDKIKNNGNQNNIQQETLQLTEFIPNLDNKLLEISGLMIYDNLLWGFNDSGGKNIIYAINLQGEIEKEIEIENAQNRDWESVTQDSTNIYIGDFGNNMGNRDNLCIYTIKKKDFNNEKLQIVTAEKINFSYAVQTNLNTSNQSTPYDCEAMVAFNNSLYIFSKNWQDFTTAVYKISTEAGSYELSPLDTFEVNGLITGADISPDNKQLALVGYQNYQSFIWLFSNFPENLFFKGDSRFFQLENTTNMQTEGICYSGNNTLLVSCERTSSFNQQVFLFDISTINNGTH